MFTNGIIPMEWDIGNFVIAQIPGEPMNPEDLSMLFSGPQFFVSLIAGVMMAFAFQLLITNFAVAAKISSDDDIDFDDDNDESLSFGKKIRQIEGKVGLLTLISVNIAIFIACFLAVKLSLINSASLGAIVGVVIWSVYFLMLVWLGSTTVGSFIGSIVNTATSGFKGVMSTAATAISGKAVNDQIVNTVEASVAAVRREISSAIDPVGVREKVEDYFGSLEVPKLDLKQIRGDFEKLLSSDDLKSLANSDVLKNVNRQTFVDLVGSRTDFSKKDIERVADQLEAAWKQVIQQQPQKQIGKGGDALESGEPQEAIAKMGKQLDESMGGDRQQEREPSLMERAVKYGTTALVGTVLNKADIGDVNVENVSGQLQQLKDKATEQAKKLGSKITENLPSTNNNTIKADVESYLLNSKPWHLNRETIKQEFKDVIYDPEAAPAGVVSQLEQLNLDYFWQILKQRSDFDDDRIGEITGQLESILAEVSETVRNAANQEQSQDLRGRVENYLRSTGKEELNPEGIERDFQALLEDPEAGLDTIKERLSQFDRDTLVELLGQREDFSPEEADRLIGQLESTRDRVLSQAQDLQEQAKSKAQEVRQKVEDYLRNTNKEELNPDGIKRDFQTLIEDPQAGIKSLRDRLSQFDRDTLVQLLSQRQDLDEGQVNQIVEQIESVRGNLLNAPQKVADKVKEQYEEITTKVGEYLRNTNLEELDPEGIKQDLTKLLHDPKQGALALRDRLSTIDRETLVKLISQRPDLSEEQVNQSVDKVLGNISSIVKAPRRLADRAKDMVMSWESSLENYLRHTNKEELNPEAIKRDLEVLFNDPKSGMQNLRDRFSQFDRSTLVSLLSQREDISEEEANQIADRIESVRNQIMDQMHNVQDKLQSVMDGVSGKIRNYLNSLERPELNYEGIKQDFRKLVDDPQAGFDAIKERLSQFDRETLVALISSREDISEADANRMIDQIESARDSAIRRYDRLQLEAQKRISNLKHQAKKQAEETRKVVATAAWWLFGTAITSVASAAIAGAMAVSGLSFIG